MYWSLSAPPSLFVNARSLAGRLSTLFSQRWPGSTVELFGSCASGLAGPNSDVDLVAHGHAELARGDPAAIVKVHDFLEERELDLVGFRPVLNARVPILRFTARIDDQALNVDLSLGQPVKVYNSLLVKAYAAERRAKVLLRLVQGWAKARGVATVFIEHTPSPYAHALLVITFLQTVVGVQNLQQRYHMPYDQPTFVDGIDVTGIGRLLPQSESRCWDRPSRFRIVHYLLHEYFLWLSNQLDPFRNGRGVSAVVSPRLGTVTLKSMTDSESWRLSIEDPVEHFDSARPRDLGDVLNQTGQMKFFSEVQRACLLLGGPNDWLSKSQSIRALFAPVETSTAPPLPLVKVITQDGRTRWKPAPRPGAANPPVPVAAAADSAELASIAVPQPDAPEDAGAFGLEGLSLGAASDDAP